MVYLAGFIRRIGRRNHSWEFWSELSRAHVFSGAEGTDKKNSSRQWLMNGQERCVLIMKRTPTGILDVLTANFLRSDL